MLRGARCCYRMLCDKAVVAGSIRAHASLQMAAANGIPADAAPLAHPVVLQWQQWNGASSVKQWEALLATSDGTTDFAATRLRLVDGSVKPGSVTGTLSDLLSKAKTLSDLSASYEALLLPVRQLEKERYNLQLQIWGLKDHIYLGVAYSTAAQIETFKKELTKSQSDLEANRKKISEYCSSRFSTESFNRLVNIFRLAGATDRHAKIYTTMLLDDMTLCQVPFDHSTQLLLKSAIFGDSPHQDSNLLFSFVENPERGEVSAATDLPAVADAAMKVLSSRHVVALTEGGKLLHQADTHPMLQRSAD